MKSGLNKNGATTTHERGTFAYENCTMLGRPVVQWDFRRADGRLFSGIANTLDLARRDAVRKAGEQPTTEVNHG